jgi:transposase
VRHYESKGEFALNTRGGARTQKITTVALTQLGEWVDDRPDMTLDSHKIRLQSQLNISVSAKTISRALTKMGFTMKLMRTIPIARNCSETIEARKIFAQMYHNDAPPDHNGIIWVDECGFNMHLRRKFGRARKGERASIEVANSRGRNISVCAAMSQEGFLYERLKPGAYNSGEFCIFLRELFVLLTARRRTACWIILDNVRFHHSQAVVACAAEFGHQLVFLPPYSPMLNPIESLFSKWKTLIRTQGVTFMQMQLLEQMTIAWAEISVSDCLGWIRDMNRNLLLSLQEHIFE